jgi:hypothetical protein
MFLHAFDQVLEHEQFISASINEIVAECMAENDYTTQNWIQWFVTEQIEEEASVRAIIDKLNLLGKNNLYMFDRDIMSMRAEGRSGRGIRTFPRLPPCRLIETGMCNKGAHELFGFARDELR